MNVNKWTLGLASVGVIGFASVAGARDEAPLSQVATALSGTVLSGYIDATATWSPGSGDIAFPGRVYDTAANRYNHDGFNLNVVSLSLSKPLDEGQWSAGYHVQTLIGPGATQRGTGSILGGGGDIALNEAYIALRVPVGNGIDLKVGQFGTFNGYEAYDTYKNPNWSRSYGFAIQPSAHTGIAASYTVNDIVSFSLGVGNTAGISGGSAVDGAPNSESAKAYLALVTLTAPESFGALAGGTLSLGYTFGPESEHAAAGNANGHTKQLYVGASIPLPVTGLSLGLAFDYTDSNSANATAIAAYLSYQATDKLKINGRFDYVSGENTFFYVNPTGADNELFAATVTVDYSLWKNVISRGEIRWDHALEGRPFGGSRTGAAVNDKDALTLTANLIYLF